MDQPTFHDEKLRLIKQDVYPADTTVTHRKKRHVLNGVVVAVILFSWWSLYIVPRSPVLDS